MFISLFILPDDVKTSNVDEQYYKNISLRSQIHSVSTIERIVPINDYVCKIKLVDGSCFLIYDSFDDISGCLTNAGYLIN